MNMTRLSIKRPVGISMIVAFFVVDADGKVGSREVKIGLMNDA